MFFYQLDFAGLFILLEAGDFDVFTFFINKDLDSIFECSLVGNMQFLHDILSVFSLQGPITLHVYRLLLCHICILFIEFLLLALEPCSRGLHHLADHRPAGPERAGDG